MWRYKRFLGLDRIKSRHSVERYHNTSIYLETHTKSDGRKEAFGTPSQTGRVQVASEVSEVDSVSGSSSDTDSSWESAVVPALTGDEPTSKLPEGNLEATLSGDDEAKLPRCFFPNLTAGNIIASCELPDGDLAATPSGDEKEVKVPRSFLRNLTTGNITASNKTLPSTLHQKAEDEPLIPSTITSRLPPHSALGTPFIPPDKHVTTSPKRKDHSVGGNEPPTKKAKLSHLPPAVTVAAQKANQSVMDMHHESGQPESHNGSTVQLDPSTGLPQPKEETTSAHGAAMGAAPNTSPFPTTYHDERAAEMLLYPLTYNDLVTDAPEKQRTRPQPKYMSGAVPQIDNTPIALRDPAGYGIDAGVDEPKQLFPDESEDSLDEDDEDDDVHTASSSNSENDDAKSPTEEQDRDMTEKKRQESLSEKAARELQAKFDAEDALRLQYAPTNGTTLADMPDTRSLMLATREQIQKAGEDRILDGFLKTREFAVLLSAFDKALNPGVLLPLRNLGLLMKVIRKLELGARTGRFGGSLDPDRLHSGLSALTDFVLDNLEQNTDGDEHSSGPDVLFVRQTQHKVPVSIPEPGSPSEHPDLDVIRVTVVMNEILAVINSNAMAGTMLATGLEKVLSCLEAICEPEVHGGSVGPDAMESSLSFLLYGVNAGLFTDMLNPACLAATLRALKKALKMEPAVAQPGPVNPQTDSSGETQSLDPALAIEALKQWSRQDEIGTWNRLLDGGTIDTVVAVLTGAAGEESPYSFDAKCVREASAELQDQRGILEEMLGPLNLAVVLEALQLAKPTVDDLDNHYHQSEVDDEMANPPADDLSGTPDHQSGEASNFDLSCKTIAVLNAELCRSTGLVQWLPPDVIRSVIFAVANEYSPLCPRVQIMTAHLVWALVVFTTLRAKRLSEGNQSRVGMINMIIKALRLGLKAQAKHASEMLKTIADSGIFHRDRSRNDIEAALQALRAVFIPGFVITVEREDLTKSVAAFEYIADAGFLDSEVKPWVLDLTLRALKRAVNLSAWRTVPQRLGFRPGLSKGRYQALDFGTGSYMIPPPLPYMYASSQAQASELQRGLVLNHARRCLISMGYGSYARRPWLGPRRWPIAGGPPKRRAKYEECEEKASEEEAIEEEASEETGSKEKGIKDKRMRKTEEIRRSTIRWDALKQGSTNEPVHVQEQTLEPANYHSLAEGKSTTTKPIKMILKSSESNNGTLGPSQASRNSSAEASEEPSPVFSNLSSPATSPATSPVFSREPSPEESLKASQTLYDSAMRADTPEPSPQATGHNCSCTIPPKPRKPPPGPSPLRQVMNADECTLVKRPATDIDRDKDSKDDDDVMDTDDEPCQLSLDDEPEDTADAEHDNSNFMDCTDQKEPEGNGTSSPNHATLISNASRTLWGSLRPAREPREPRELEEPSQ